MPARSAPFGRSGAVDMRRRARPVRGATAVVVALVALAYVVSVPDASASARTITAIGVLSGPCDLPGSSNTCLQSGDVVDVSTGDTYRLEVRAKYGVWCNIGPPHPAMWRLATPTGGTVAYGLVDCAPGHDAPVPIVAVMEHTLTVQEPVGGTGTATEVPSILGPRSRTFPPPEVPTAMPVLLELTLPG